MILKQDYAISNIKYNKNKFCCRFEVDFLPVPILGFGGYRSWGAIQTYATPGFRTAEDAVPIRHAYFVFERDTTPGELGIAYNGSKYSDMINPNLIAGAGSEIARYDIAADKIKEINVITTNVCIRLFYDKLQYGNHLQPYDFEKQSDYMAFKANMEDFLHEASPIMLSREYYFNDEVYEKERLAKNHEAQVAKRKKEAQKLEDRMIKLGLQKIVI